MIIKKFQGKTELEAIELAKKELGAAVVVMNVKEVKRKGLFAFLKPKMTEVTVALEEETERTLPGERLAKAEIDKSMVRQAPPQSPESKKESAFANAIKKGDVIPDDAPMPDKKPSESHINVRVSDDAKMSTSHTSDGLGERLDNLQTLIEKQIQQNSTLDKDEHADKIEYTKKNEEEDMADQGNVRFLKLLYNTMLENEISEVYANQIIDELDSVIKPNMPIDYMLSHVYQKMILKFGQTAAITPAKEGPKVVFFVGPTGVGKTTTIAKIASRFSVEEKKKVALLTMDTYRIAAAEQLRTYANILEVPFRIIYTVDELLLAIKEFAQFDYIFLDTAGHSHQNVTQRDAMLEFIHAVDDKIEKEIYLVVSATTKYKDLLSIADSYKAVPYHLIFTKLDETSCLGNLLNLKLHTGAKMSYVTCGQNVPDDMEDFNPQKTVKILLGGNQIS